MNIVDFAEQILEMHHELAYLRLRVAQQDVEIANYRDHVQDSIEGYENMFGSILIGCLEGKIK